MRICLGIGTTLYRSLGSRLPWGSPLPLLFELEGDDDAEVGQMVKMAPACASAC